MTTEVLIGAEQISAALSELVREIAALGREMASAR